MARIAGDAVGADNHLPNMATAEFLACLSKAAVEDVAVGLSVPVQPTGKATRGAVIARVGEGRWLYPSALFAAAEAATVPARPGESALDHHDTSEATPQDNAGKDHTDGNAGIGGDETETETPPPPDEHEGSGAPEADDPPAVPVRRRRSRKDSDEARAAA